MKPIAPSASAPKLVSRTYRPSGNLPFRSGALVLHGSPARPGSAAVAAPLHSFMPASVPADATPAVRGFSTRSSGGVPADQHSLSVDAFGPWGHWFFRPSLTCRRFRFRRCVPVPLVSRRRAAARPGGPLEAVGALSRCAPRRAPGSPRSSGTAASAGARPSGWTQPTRRATARPARAVCRCRRCAFSPGSQ